VEFTANLSLNGEALEITEAQAMIRSQEGRTETIPFPSGRNVSASWTPRDPGTYAVDIVVTGQAPDGSTIERTGFLAVEVQSNSNWSQIIFNLVLLIAAVLLILLGIILGVVGLLRRLSRSRDTHKRMVGLIHLREASIC
jgi:hypothetical protein